MKGLLAGLAGVALMGVGVAIGVTIKGTGGRGVETPAVDEVTDPEIEALVAYYSSLPDPVDGEWEVRELNGKLLCRDQSAVQWNPETQKLDQASSQFVCQKADVSANEPTAMPIRRDGDLSEEQVSKDGKGLVCNYTVRERKITREFWLTARDYCPANIIDFDERR